MPVVHVDSLDDPRVAAYRNLKDRDLSREGGRFMAEGELVVRRLLASAYGVESVLCVDRKIESLAPVVPPEIPIYAATAGVINQIVGYKFHSGVMAVGFRGAGATIEQMLAGDGPRTLVVCPKTEKSDNLGSLIRIAAAFGVSGMVLGPQCCDPFYRQSVRVSMGTIFAMPIVRSNDLAGDLLRIRQEHAVELVATVLEDGAEVLERCGRAPRMALLLGNEGDGLERAWIELCNRRVTIPMEGGTDSLNVSVAAGVFLYHFMRVAG